jgi:hypothetical protein
LKTLNALFLLKREGEIEREKEKEKKKKITKKQYRYLDYTAPMVDS